MNVPSLLHVRREYDALRARYFLDAAAPLHIPPTSAELRWMWLAHNAPMMAETIFDEDGEPEEVRVLPMAAVISRVLRSTLLHELTHMRVWPRCHKSCTARYREWRVEQTRLAALGAPLL